MHHKKWLALTLTAVLALGPLTGCGSKADNTEDDGQTAAASSAPSAAPVSSDSADEAVFRTPATVDLTGAVEIGLNGTSVEISGSGANEENGVISITSGGTYVLSGTLQDGCVIVDAKDKDVTLVLNGADITCSDGSPLYIYNVQSATVHLMEGTQNTLTDGAAYTLTHAAYSAAEEEPNACLYSKDDLILQGAGALEINANYNNGITGKDTLEIYDLTLTVN
ncbi:MAG: carbohydrate-binding domain-containing protein, partial [Butyricicoccus sp.]